MASRNYLKDGRLPDVIALIQVLAFDRDTHRTESGLKDELQRLPASGGRWLALASQHPEFFRVSRDGDRVAQVALLARYVLPRALNGDGDAKKPPLDPDHVGKLLSLAVQLHDKEIERASRFRLVLLPVMLTCIGAGATIGAAAIGLLKGEVLQHAQTPQAVSAPVAPDAGASTPPSLRLPASGT